MKRLMNLVPVLSLLALTPVAAYAQEAAFHAPAPGTKCEYRYKNSKLTYVFGTRDGLIVDFKISTSNRKNIPSGTFGWLISTLAGDTKKVEFPNREQIEAFWPLRVGNQASWSAKARGQKWDFVARAVAYEKVDVPAGSYDAFVIEKTEDNVSTGPRPDKTFKIWWSPELGAIVKQSSAHHANQTLVVWELASCTVN